ncbi:hypothetical protein [Streptomyces atroolivaceus]|uniref:hypothetical protein n=1 Tax=Streptomyces atroolivaceus TaxID=66869 RepID=UPI0036CCB9B4
MIEALPDDVAHVLDFALSFAGAPSGVQLGMQIRHLRVQKRCACGCGSTYFSLDVDAVAPALTLTGTQVVGDMEVLGERQETIGQVQVFTEDGYLAWLEVCSWNDDSFTLADAHRRLCPCLRRV